MKAHRGASPEDPTPVEANFRLALDALFDEVTIAEAIRDDHGRIEDFIVVHVNNRLTDGAGRSGDQIIGRRLLDLFPGCKENGLLDRFIAVVETGEPFIDDRLHFTDVVEDDIEVDGSWSLSVAKFGDGYLAASRDVGPVVLAEQERRRVELDLQRNRLAVEYLQAASLPTSLPMTPGLDIAVRYSPAATLDPIGGDWYDLFEFDDGRIGLVIADIAGHGPEAASFMVQVRNIVRAYAFTCGDPEDVLAASNEMVHRLDEPQLFATCCYLVLDAATGSMDWASAGHIAPLVLGDPSRYLDGRVGPPLGVDARASFDRSLGVLARGEQLVMFTDGLVEERDQPITASLDALLAPLRDLEGQDAQTTVDRLVAAAPRTTDDLAVLCVRRR